MERNKVKNKVKGEPVIAVGKEIIDTLNIPLSDLVENLQKPKHATRLCRQSVYFAATDDPTEADRKIYIVLFTLDNVPHLIASFNRFEIPSLIIKTKAAKGAGTALCV